MPNKDNGVPVGRYYSVILIVAVIGWTAGFFHGKDVTAKKEAEIAMQQQEKVLDIHTEVYSNLPRSYDASFDWLFDNTD